MKKREQKPFKTEKNNNLPPKKKNLFDSNTFTSGANQITHLHSTFNLKSKKITCLNPRAK